MSTRKYAPVRPCNHDMMRWNPKHRWWACRCGKNRTRDDERAHEGFKVHPSGFEFRQRIGSIWMPGPLV